VKVPAKTPDESRRLEVLRDYALLDTPPEQIFDDLTELAAHICEAPIALISLVDENRQWFKSRVGLTVEETARDISFCGHAILQPALFIVPDATKDERFADNPLVTGEPRIRFYAAAPLVTPAGYALGTLCVIDRIARQLNAWQQQALQVLGRLVITHLELRRKARDLSSVAQAEKQLREHLEMSERARQSLLSILEDQQQIEVALRESEVQLQCILGSTADGILTVDRSGKVIHANRRFAELWRIPQSLLETRDEQALLSFVQDRLNDPETFLKKVQVLYQSDAEDVDTLTFKDGRVFERYSSPLRLHGAVAGRVWSFRDITPRMQAEQALAQAEARFRHLLNSSPSVIYATTANPDLHQCTFVSDTLTRMTGYWPQEMLNDPKFWLARVHPDDVKRALSEIESRIQQGGGSLVYRFRHKNGEYLWIRDTFRVIPAAGGQPIEVVGSWTDITVSRRMEEQLAQSQKMEAVGQLTGGVAHDFNNRLTVILGNLDLLQRRLGNDPAAARLPMSALSAADGAAELTRRLLAFSRQQVLEPTIININELVTGMCDLLQSTLGETINVVISAGADLWPVRTDRNLLENVLLNLAVNARDAMPRGGTLTIESHNIVLSEDYVKDHPYASAGEYVQLTVSDTGMGMSEEIKRRIFEPFFTTKPAGKGTGLGLAMVYGFVKQSGGHIEVYSEPEHGTSFKIYLPRDVSAEGVSLAAPGKKADDEDARIRDKVILLVEDDDAVREFSTLQLKEMGCQVLTANNGPAALELFASHPDIDLLFTDVIMPCGMTGLELATKMRESLPELKVLYTSGYAPQAAADRRIIKHPNDFWLAKPYRSQGLRDAVWRALSAKTSGPRPAPRV